MEHRLSWWFERGRSEAAARRFQPSDFVSKHASKNEAVVREGFAAKAKRYLRQLPIAADVVAMYFCMLDRRTPAWVKGVAGAALAYFVLPLDALWDVVPGVGLTDDVAVLAAALTAVSSHVTGEHRSKARAWMEAEAEQVARAV